MVFAIQVMAQLYHYIYSYHTWSRSIQLS